MQVIGFIDQATYFIWTLIKWSSTTYVTEKPVLAKIVNSKKTMICIVNEVGGF